MTPLEHFVQDNLARLPDFFMCVGIGASMAFVIGGLILLCSEDE